MKKSNSEKPRRQRAQLLAVAPRARAREAAAELGPPRRQEPLKAKRPRAALVLDLVAHGFQPSEIAKLLETKLGVIRRYLSRIGLGLVQGSGPYDLQRELAIERLRFDRIRRRLFRAMESTGPRDPRLAGLVRELLAAGDSEGRLLERLGLRAPQPAPSELQGDLIKKWLSMSPEQRNSELAAIREKHLRALTSAAPEQKQLALRGEATE